MSAVLHTPDSLESQLMSLPAFVEEAIGEMPLGKFIAAHLAGDPILASRELDALVAAYLESWVADRRKRQSVRMTEEQALLDGIAIFTETARKWPIGLVRPPDPEFLAAMKAGIPGIAPPVLSNNERITTINQERLDHEAANPQTRTNYKGNL